MSIAHSQLAKSTTKQMFGSLSSVLSKAEAHAAANGIEETVLLDWRFTPDMFPMCRQVQIVTDVPARGLARLAGAEVPVRADTERSFAELKARLSWADDFIAGLNSAAIDQDPEAAIEFPAGKESFHLPRGKYLTGFILPNLYFHVSMAYGLLRAGGVELGKRDYLGL